MLDYKIPLSICVGAIPKVVLALTLHLVCLGTGTVDHLGGLTETDFARSTSPVDGQINIDITSDTAKIRIPDAMIPTIHSGKDGWSQLKDIKETENEIRASIALGFLHSPRMRIDRLTGMISIDGSDERFSAKCQSYDPASAVRQF